MSHPRRVCREGRWWFVAGTFCVLGGHCEHYRLFIGFLGLCPLGAISTPSHLWHLKIAPDIATCPLRGKITLLENHCAKWFAYIVAFNPPQASCHHSPFCSRWSLSHKVVTCCTNVSMLEKMHPELRFLPTVLCHAENHSGILLESHVVYLSPAISVFFLFLYLLNTHFWRISNVPGRVLDAGCETAMNEILEYHCPMGFRKYKYSASHCWSPQDKWRSSVATLSPRWPPVLSLLFFLVLLLVFLIVISV